MGGNRRFEGHRAETEDQKSAARPKPQGLSREEVDLDRATVRYPKDGPIPVQVWVRYPEVILQNAIACAWTDRAVLVEIVTDAGAQRLWVWASAVRRR